LSRWRRLASDTVKHAGSRRRDREYERLGLVALFIAYTGTHGDDTGKDNHHQEGGSYKNVMHGRKSLFGPGDLGALLTVMRFADASVLEHSTKAFSTERWSRG
jgi:hypothetical protein